MIRRPRRTVPAVVVALVLLAAAVLVTWSCVQVLLGQVPVLPFGAMAAAGAALTADSVPVLVTGAVLAVLGLLLVVIALRPGRPTVLALAHRPDVGHATSWEEMDRNADPSAQPDSGATRRSVSSAITAAAAGVDGVDHASVKLTGRVATATVNTPLRSSDLSDQVRDAVSATLDDIGLARPLRVRVRSGSS